MRKIVFAVSLLAAMPAVAATFDVPPRKAGQWKIEIVPETKGAAPAMTTEVCLDADSDKAMMANGMAKDYSWDVQGPEYVELYRRLAG